LPRIISGIITLKKEIDIRAKFTKNECEPEKTGYLPSFKKPGFA